MYDICLTVSAWCIIGLLGVLFISSARREISRRALLINRTPNRPMIHHAETVRQISYMFLASLVSLVWLDCILSLRFHTFGIG